MCACVIFAITGKKGRKAWPTLVYRVMASEEDIIQLYNPPEECPHGRCNNLFIEFVYCVIIPAVIVILLIILLAIIMLCNSKSCKCRKYSSLQPQTNDIQLENYNSIRRATANLRLMSQNRETPLLGSRASSMTLDRSQRRLYRPRDSSSSAPGTLQRQLRSRLQDQSVSSGPPPPYSIDPEESFTGQPKRVLLASAELESPPPPPPAYRPHSDEVFLGPDFLESDTQVSARYDDSPDHNGSGVRPLLYQRSHDT